MIADQYADRVRLIIENENTLENYRLQWMLVIHGFLLTGLGASLGSGIEVKISWIFASLGFVTSLSTFCHLMHGRLAISRAARDFRTQFSHYEGPSVIGLDVNDLVWFVRFITPPYVLPVLFMIAWVAVPICLRLWSEEIVTGC